MSYVITNIILVPLTLSPPKWSSTSLLTIYFYLTDSYRDSQQIIKIPDRLLL